MKKMICAMVAITLAAIASSGAFAYTLPLSSGYLVTNGFWDCNVQCYHLGDDLVASVDEPVRSICAGRVVEVTYRNNPGNYGGRVLVECPTSGGPVVLLYGHLGMPTSDPMTSDILVRRNDMVREGQIIGKIGARNENGGFIPHLHLGIHRGAYQGTASECSRWTYAGYTARRYTAADTCMCGILDNWYDPSEFLGIEPASLRIVDGNVTPESGIVDDTEFSWEMTAEGGRGAPLQGTVFIWDTTLNIEQPVGMRRDSTGTGFSWTSTLSDEGFYAYRFKVETCAESTEEQLSRPGPRVEEQTPACIPQAESCNMQDDDCDGEIDENITIPCQTACGSGVRICDIGRFLPCTAPMPQQETCNGRDDDCDGQIDEQIERPCGNSCGNTGIETCSGGQWGSCSAATCPPACTPFVEVCDNQDNNCNGSVDENLSRSCSNQCGNRGTETCANGQWGMCMAQPCCWPSSEVCDGMDNDCNGQIDDNLVRSCSNQCGGNGTQRCTAGTWGSCSAPACPPPMLPAPALQSPAEGHIESVPTWIAARTTLQWSPVPSATRYEYVVRYSGSQGPGATVENSTTGSLSHTFTQPHSEYGKKFEWQVRAIDMNGNAGSWSASRTVFLSYVSGSVLQCADAACPQRGAWYQVSTSIAPAQSSGAPDQLILDWVSGNCTRGRMPEAINFREIQGYARSARFNGCPP